MTQKPSFAFIAASWVAFGTGIIGYFSGIFGNKELQLSDKGYYFTVIMFALFSVISVQKSVRDRLEGIPVTDLYYGISGFVPFYPSRFWLLVCGMPTCGEAKRVSSPFHLYLPCSEQ